MNENVSKRREWVKNAAIVFLTVMLILTFFSNTIMNYSLPMVAAQYINSGSITAKVRGTGTIEAADPYSVELTETRVIESVKVRQGDYVEKDQVLFLLKDAESEELKAAEDALEAALLEFKKSILTGDISAGVVTNVQAGVETPTDTYRKKIVAAQNNYDTLQAQLDELQKQKSLVALNTGADTTAEETALANAETKLASAKANLSAIQGSLPSTDEATAKANAESLLTVANAYLLDVQNAEALMKVSSAKMDALNLALSAQQAYADAKANVPDGTLDPEADPVVIEKKTALNGAIDNANALACGGEKDDHPKCVITGEDINKCIADVNGDYQANATAYTTKKAKYDEAYANYLVANEQYLLFGQKRNAEAAVNSAQKEVTNAQNALNNKIASGDNSKQLAEIEKKIIETQAAVDKAQSDLTQLLDDIQAELTLGAQSDTIKELREKVEELRADAIGAEVKAPISGTIASVSCVAGETVQADSAMAVIQPDGKGFSMKFSVTAEQAKRLTPGDPAEVQNSWYYSDITATLAQIANDPDNPGRNKLLIFDIDGDVMGGQSLSLSVGQKSANYDMIVPNSAIREDNNGKFVLIVESKSSPLGNRYIATRVDVEVLASDDMQSAISGALYGYEFVITTSNKPVEAGKQVRLSDS